MNKKGFTLVELLAVIVILAVILVIAVPQITDVIRSTKEASFISSAKLIVRGAESKYEENNILGKSEAITCESVSNISSSDYETCEIEFEEDTALITIVGKGKFDKMSICNKTKDNIEVVKGCTNILTFDANGGEVSTTTKNILIDESYGELPTPTRGNYTFLGWYTEKDAGTKIEATTKVSTNSSHTLYAHWIENKKYDYIAPTTLIPNPYYTFTTLVEGYYKIELWGAGGGNEDPTNQGGRGGYSAGITYLEKEEKLYIFIGQQGNGCDPYTSCTGLAYNGGGAGGFYTQYTFSRKAGGGGATDIRINGTALADRIMVASSGGSGAGAGSGGGLIGYNGGSGSSGGIIIGKGATQISGGAGKNNGKFGVGGNGYVLYSNEPNCNGAGGGGGGYYGGGGPQSGNSGCSPTRGNSGGGGGSSYISGHQGCIAINNTNPITAKCSVTVTDTTPATQDYVNIDASCSKHYSGKVFTDTLMIDGEGYTWTNKRASTVGTNLMPNPEGGYYASGNAHTGNGYARITFIE